MSIADHDAVGIGLDADDEFAVAPGDAESFSLADREAFDAGMYADDRAVGGDELAGAIGVVAATHKFVVAATGDEADFLAVLFVGHAQAKVGGDASDRWLFVAPDRQHHTWQEIGADAEEDVRLILGF